MPSFLARGLERLSDVFGIKGSQVSTDLIDLGGVQLVADVLKLAGQGGQRAVGFAGSGLYNMTTTHAAANVQVAEIQIYDGLTLPAPSWPDPVPLECDIWVLSAFAVETGVAPTALAQCNIYLKHSPEAQLAGQAQLVQPRRTIFTGNVAAMLITGAAGPWAIPPLNELPSPMKVPRVAGTAGSATLILETRATAANVTVQANVEVLALARGLHPWG